MANINPPPPLEEKKTGLRATTTISKALIIEEVKEDSDQEDDIAKRMKELNVVDDTKNNAFKNRKSASGSILAKVSRKVSVAK